MGWTSLLIAAAVAAGTGSTPRTPPDLSKATVVDLSHPFDEKTIYWPTSPSAFELKKLSFGMTPGGWFYAANTLCTPEHGGTHLDAPIHFAKDGKTLDQIPVRQLIAPAVVIDVSAKAEADPDYRLSADDLHAWERQHGAVPSGAIVLLRTGWAKRWSDRKRYLGDDTPGDASKLHFPATERKRPSSWCVSATSERSVSTPRRSTTGPRGTSSSIRSPAPPESPASRTWPTLTRCRRWAPGSSPCR